MKVAVTTLAVCVTALLSLGLVMLYSSGLYHKFGTDVSSRFLMKQLQWCAAGLVACVVAATLDYRSLKRFVWPLLGCVAILLALVLRTTKYSPNLNGANRWFVFPGISFQPSELAKIALIIALAWYCERYQRQMHTWKRGMLVPSLFIGLIAGLIFVERDVGCALLITLVSGLMLLIAGIQLKQFVPSVLALAVAASIFIYNDDVRRERVVAWLNMEEKKSEKASQAYQTMLALGSGGWTGLGLGNGRQKNGWVAEHQTDFILAIIGEELGLVATLGVVLGFVLIVICGIYIAVHARDTFGLMLAAGITFLIGFQAFINIGVVTNTLPNKGIALPFISYGGSSLLAMLGCIGLLISVARQGRAPEIKPANPFAADELPTAQTT
ncbi:MAG: putative peptidoglycan glycosyltransferase FtsW [Verrucomicrobiota bacterium]|nr:cell division protein FtsW [Verrucomicrobiota bacterium]MCC6820144.1 cell division protein FtsW [Limisphaerales bacterium]